jgi:hypothetical protein
MYIHILYNHLSSLQGPATRLAKIRGTPVENYCPTEQVSYFYLMKEPEPASETSCLTKNNTMGNITHM